MLAAVFFTTVVDLIGFGLILPLLPFYAIHYGASPFTVALLAVVFSIAQFAAAPVLGGLSDRYGRKPVYLLCTAISALGYIWLAFADTLLVIFLARILAGIGSGKIGMAQAIIADVTTPDKRAKGMGLIGAAFGLGMILGPVLGGLLIGPDEANPRYAWPAFAAAAASTAALLLALATLRETHVVNSAPRSLFSNPLAGIGDLNRRALALIIVNFAINFVFAQIETLFPLFTATRLGWHAYDVGLAFTFIGCVVLTMQGFLIGPLTRWMGERWVLSIGLIILATGTAMTWGVFSVALMAVSILCTAGGFGMVNPSINSLISRNADEGRQGLTMGVNQAMAALGRVAGPIFGGLLFDEVGITLPYLIGGVLLLLVLAFGWRTIHGTPRKA